MRYTPSDFGIRFLTTALLLLVFEIIGATVLPSLISYQFRFFFLGIFCIYIALKLPSSFQPYMFLILSWIHSIFSLEGWAFNCLIALILAVVLSIVKDLIQLGTYWSKVFFYFLGLLTWDILRVIILNLKTNSFENFFILVSDDLLSNIVLALLTPLFLIPLSGIWKVYKTIEV